MLHRKLVGALMVGALGVLLTPVASRADAGPAGRCQAAHIPAAVPDVPRAQLYGELCLPWGRTPDTVQLLVHGATYTHDFWDFPYQPARYSYVRKAVSDGYATFDVDRLGNGQSTRPDSSLVTFGNDAMTLHSVVAALRSGAIGGHAFSRVVWVGHSMGALAGWVEASLYHDVDAFVLADMMHYGKPSFFATVAQDAYAASEDPKFAALGLDDGYLTSKPGTRGEQYYWVQGADPAVIAEDERLKDIVTATERAEARGYTGEAADSATSRAITVPTLLVVGDHDNIFCGPPDGLDCTQAEVLAHEAPYYSRRAQLQADVIPNTGHDFQLHLSAPRADRDILTWIDRWRRGRG